MLVVGIDPGNDAAGISFWVDGEYVSSRALRPWADDAGEYIPAPLFMRGAAAKWRIYVEVPQNGTHASRGGVHWAGGMLVAQLLDVIPELLRRHVKKITPNTWRKGLGLATKKAGKDYYVAAAEKRAGHAFETEASPES